MLETMLVAALAAAPPEPLRALIERSLEVSPELAALDAEAAALRHGVVAASAWQHPRLSVAYQNVPVDSWALGEEPMSMVQARIEQTLPLPGKTPRRQAELRSRLEVVAWARRERSLQLRARIRRAFFQLTLVRQLQALTREHVGLSAQLEAAVAARYRVGGTSQHDLIRVGVWQSRLEDDQEELERRARELAATLNALAHHPLDRDIPTPAQLELPPMPQSLTELVTKAQKNRPALRGAVAEAVALRAAADAARYEAVPDITLFAAYGIRPALATGAGGRDLATVGVSLPIPVFFGARHEALAAQKEAGARAVELRRAQLSDEIAARLAAAHAALQRAAQRVGTYRETLLPAARRAVEATLSAYRVDRADFASLFSAQVELLELEKTLRRATVEAVTAEADMAALVGEDPR
jgi:outer membrane protein TolC